MAVIMPTRNHKRLLIAVATTAVWALQGTNAFSHYANNNKNNNNIGRKAILPRTVISSSAFQNSYIDDATTLIDETPESSSFWRHHLGRMAAAAALTALLSLSGPVWAENELSAKYGSGLDTSLVDQTCLVNHCSLQATTCMVDDPNCRKGLTCTAKCLGDNACITGCMARYGNTNLDQLLKCTIEDHACIKVAILEGGSDPFGQEPKAPVPTVPDFDPQTLQGVWYKVVGYNPNYDCYACQRNTFSYAKTYDNALLNNINNPFVPNNKLRMDVEFSMPHLLPDGSPPPPSNARESLRLQGEQLVGSESIGLNDYNTHETMIFDRVVSPVERLVLHKGTDEEVSYARTAHSEGEMFGLSKYSLLENHFMHRY